MAGKKSILLALGALFAVALITASSRPVALETVADEEEPLNVDAGSLPESGATVERYLTAPSEHQPNVRMSQPCSPTSTDDYWQAP
jgi:hypothetical protein